MRKVRDTYMALLQRYLNYCSKFRLGIHHLTLWKHLDEVNVGECLQILEVIQRSLTWAWRTMPNPLLDHGQQQLEKTYKC